MIFSLSVCAYGAVMTEEILSDKEDAQNFIDTFMCENAGVCAEWFVFALSDGGYDFSKYTSALDDHIFKNTPEAVTSLKYALVYRALEIENEYVKTVCDELSGEKGIMYAVFSLHLLNNGVACKTASSADIAEKIVNMQNSDGGWSVIKGNSDVDVSAMALQALAPHSEKYAECIEKAVAFLSEGQTENGGFKSYGVENAESASQVIIALSDLKIDCKNDERFIKNGHTAFDFLEAFKAEDGYSHTSGGNVSPVASSQVLCAFSAYASFENDGSPFYIFDKKAPSEVIPAPDTDASTMPTDSDTNAPHSENEGVPTWRYVFIAVVVFIGIAGCALLFIFKKTKPQNFIVIAVCCGVIIAASFFIELSTPTDYYNDASQNGTPTGEISISVNADDIGAGDILPLTSVPIYSGSTAYDALITAAKKFELIVGANGVGEYAYIKSINGISELQHGDLSGWTYTVNGEYPAVGCGAYELKDGDKVCFIYTTDRKMS